MGPGKLAGGLGVSLEEAKAKIAQYKSTYPAVERFMAEAVEEGKKYGFAFTVLGRRRNIPMIASSNKGEQALGERLAVNTQIQGSAADVTRLAQVAIDVCGLDKIYGCYNTLQVHDELVFECPAETAMQAKTEIEELMAHPFSRDLLCPLIAEAGVGDSWGEAK
jgi:DNA polymerase-1